jgi:ubiquinone/menaquinone biosynthesis C-methylase UbiE
VPEPVSTVTAENPRGLDINLRSGPQMREYEAIADRVAAERSGPVLDWGCGWGQVSSLLHERGVEVEAFDYRADEPVHDVELEHFSGFRVQVSGDPVALPYPDDHFAAALSCGVLEHVQDPDASLDELRRILRPGGRLYVYKLPNRLSYLEAIAKRMGLYYHGALPDDRLYDPASTRKILTRHGFRVDELRLANMLPLTISHPLAGRYAGQIWRINVALGRLPVVNRVATNVEAVASRL